MTFTLTAEQELILHRVSTSKDNLAIEARAGAAKTTTLVKIAEVLGDQSILALAFNKKIATEMNERLPDNATAKTLNALGDAAFRAFRGKHHKIEDKKCFEILSSFARQLEGEESEELYDRFAETLQAIRAAKNVGYVPEGAHPLVKSLLAEEDFFMSLDEEPSDVQRAAINKTLVASIKMAFEGFLDFADQIYLSTLIKSVSFPRYDVVLVDEAQDLSELNHMMLSKIVRGSTRLIVVGDECQPDGTLVTRVVERANRWHPAKLEQVPIEDICEGDTLLGYNGEGAFLYDRKVEGITRRPYEGQLVSVTGPGFTSRYTPNHHCYVSFEPLRSRHALYLMQRGEVFRLGICKMDYGDTGSGPIVRARHEDADAVWLLETYETEREAFKHEAFYQAKFGIPDLTFLEPSSNLDRGFLSSFWSMCESLNLNRRARDCLAFFGRDYAYPLWEKGQPYTSLKRPIVTYACNLISGCLMLPFTGESKVTRSAWQPIDVGREPYSGFVTSFTISDNHLYVADSLVTHNCQAIYGFRGASEESMKLLSSRFNLATLYLTVCFRCAPEIVENVRWRAPDMTAFSPPGGKVEHHESWSLSEITDGDAVICRNNAPLFSLAVKLLAAGRSPELYSGDIVPGLVKIMKKLGKPGDATSLGREALLEWKEKESARSRSPGSVEDKAACIQVFLDEAETLGEAIRKIETVAAASGRIKLMTGHKSKGLEFNRVWFLDKQLCRPKGQDLNLRYVIETRARKELHYIESEKLQ